MAQWKVTREQIQIFPHPNPEVLRLELGKCGQYQVVVGKGIFKDGSTIIFVPEKSVLPDSIADEGDRRKYLIGTEKNRVKALVMQKEITQGIILDDRPEFAHIPLGEDISHLLGITRYVAPVPKELEGKVFSLTTIDHEIHRHEVELYNIYPNEFVPGERVIVTEKIHGTQGVYVKSADGTKLVTSKGLIASDQFFDESADVAYRTAATKIKLFDLLEQLFPKDNIQVFGEVAPFHKGFNYGLTEKTLFLFRVDKNGTTLSYDAVPDELKKHWVPKLYDGPFDLAMVRSLKEGRETVSGKSLHIKEGVVVTPAEPRRSSTQFRLALKLLNSKYTPDEEDFS